MSIKKVKSKKFPGGYGWKIDFHRDGVPRVRKVFESKKLAQDVLDALTGDYIRRQHNLHVESHVTLRELVDTHLDRIRKRRPKVARVETILNRFAKIAGETRLVETIKTSDLSDYAKERVDDELKPQSINREMVEIKSCLTNAKQYFSTLEEWRSPVAPWQEESSDGRRRVWTDDEYESVIRELYGEKREGERNWQFEARRMVGDMFIIANQTGMRAGEIRHLKKSNVNLTARVITITSQKGKSRQRKARTREIPMTDEVFGIVSRRVESVASEWLFPNRRGDGPTCDRLKAFKSACERAKVNYGAETPGGVVFNDARRTAENRMLDDGHSARTVGEIMGHSIETMTKHYVRTTDNQKRAAIQSTRKVSVQILPTEVGQTVATGSTEEETKAAKMGG